MILDDYTKEILYLADPVLRINKTFDLGFDLDPVQEEIIRDESSRIIVNCTRQWGKTTTVAAKAAVLAKEGAPLTLLIAPVERQAREIFRKVRGFLKLNENEEIWAEDNKLSLELPNGARIIALPARGETIRGYTNPTMIIIDEAAFVEDADYRSIRPMLSHGAKLTVMSTPFGRRGFFYEIWKSEDERWSRYRVTASECAHIPKDFLEEEKIALGQWWYEQEYECAFQSNVAGYFDMDIVREALQSDISVMSGYQIDAFDDFIDTSIEPLFENMNLVNEV